MLKKLIYLASPYSHPSPAIRQQRFEAACAAAATLMKSGYLVFSPIAHSHPIAKCLGRECELDFNLWLDLDKRILPICDILAILTIEGWQSSRGVRAEVEMARRQNRTVRYLSPDCEFIDDLLMN